MAIKISKPSPRLAMSTPAFFWLCCAMAVLYLPQAKSGLGLRLLDHAIFLMISISQY
jgi:hypothetical protein